MTKKRYHVLLVTGGRKFDDAEAVGRTIARLVERCESDGSTPVVISGGATGADKLARQAATAAAVRFEEFRADWKGRGKKAGFERNQRMLDALITARSRGHQVTVVAFEGGNGTAHMTRIAKEAGVRVALPTPAPEMVPA